MRKVLRITNSLDFGGIEKVFELHARYFNKKDYELVFVAIEKGGFASNLLTELGFRVIILNKKCKIPSLQACIALFKLFRDERPDVVHTCGAEANFHGLLAAFFLGVKCRVAEEIGIPSHSFKARVIFKFIYLFAHQVIAISHAVASYLTKNEVSKNKVSVLYNPIEVKTSVKKPNPIDHKIILCFLGRLEPIKNCESIIHMMGRLESLNIKKELELWIIGDGSQRNSLEQLAAQIGANVKVKFLGFQSKPDAIMEQAHIFVLPSWNEGFGLACIEAIQSGLIVVASQNGGMKEFIQDNYNGFIIDPSIPSEMDEKTLIAINQSNSERELFSQRAITTISEMFSPGNYLSGIKTIYSSKEN